MKFISLSNLKQYNILIQNNILDKIKNSFFNKILINHSDTQTQINATDYSFVEIKEGKFIELTNEDNSITISCSNEFISENEPSMSTEGQHWLKMY